MFSPSMLLPTLRPICLFVGEYKCGEREVKERRSEGKRRERKGKEGMGRKERRKNGEDKGKGKNISLLIKLGVKS